MQKVTIPKVQKKTAVKQAIEYLKKYIFNSTETELRKLPSEAQLASELGISRLTVREALTVLENEGFITRSQGNSTIITTFARKLTGKLDSSGELGNFIKESGYQATVEHISYSWETCSEELANKLNIQPGNELLVVKKRFLADGTPVAFCINHIPKVYLAQETFDEAELGEDLFKFIQKTTGVYFSHDFMELIPSVVNEEISKVLNLAIHSPLLRLDITKYTDSGQPVMLNTEYYVHDLIKFTACRTISSL